MRQLYILFRNEIWQPVVTKLTWSHCIILMSLKNKAEIDYYIGEIIKYNLSKRKLIDKIKNKEYERLDEETKNKLIKNEEINIQDFIKHPIIIKNNNYDKITEKILKQLILEDIENFLTELGEGFTFIKSEYKIKV